MAVWRDDIVAALLELGEPTKLQDIYDAVAKRRTFLPKSFHAIIRREIEQNSSDSDVWNGKQDLFHALQGKGSGIWALRSNAVGHSRSRDEATESTTSSSPLSSLTSPTAVRLAIEEYQRLGEERFLSTYGFGKSREYTLSAGGKEYASKAIAGVAFGYQFPNEGFLHSGKFSGGVASGSAANVLDLLGFTISNMPSTGRRPGWSLAECEITADAYFQSLRKKLNKESFNRQQAIRDVSKVVQRTEGAIDYKFQNIDAILSKAGLPRLNDAIASKVQTLLEYVVLDPLAKRFATAVETQNTIATPSGQVFVPVPTIAKPRRTKERLATTIAKFEFSEVEEKQREIGRLGEQFVLRVERDRLSACGRDDLAGQVKWVSDEIGDGLGYDIESFDDEGAVIFIEVKTTNQGPQSPFFITANELLAASRLGPRFRLYRVFNLSGSPQIYVLQGPLESRLTLTAKVYAATPMASVG